MKNLKNIGDRPDHKELCAKGGRTVTAKKGVAMKIAWLKRKGMTDETAAHLHEVMTDAKLSALDMRMFLERLRPALKSTDDKFKMSKALNDWHKITHGDKQQIEHFGSSGIRVIFEKAGKRESDE